MNLLTRDAWNHYLLLYWHFLLYLHNSQLLQCLRLKQLCLKVLSLNHPFLPILHIRSHDTLLKSDSFCSNPSYKGLSLMIYL
ncbi:hypothetical protein FGO68_gene14670 [Halteria grandinella]|uniref:Uncharacterized protein n=1 Tax=Halteria grandinella TaxID=5974 RepID=A0A8J8NLE6_HALGN|nr:hypothetical protein FGO68_gene14670 [Halteria grandinella]